MTNIHFWAFMLNNEVYVFFFQPLFSFTDEHEVHKVPLYKYHLTWVLLKSSIGEIEAKKTYEILSLSNSLFSFLIWAFIDHHFYAIKAFSITLFFFFSDTKEQVSALTGYALTSTFKVLGVCHCQIVKHSGDSLLYMTGWEIFNFWSYLKI